MFPLIEAKTIDPPSTLNDMASAQWKSLIPFLLNSKILAPQDLVMLESAFILMGEYYDAYEEIQKIRRKKKPTQDDIMRRAKLNIWMTRSIKECNSILCRFGISPSERAKLTSVNNEDSDEEIDPLAIVLGEVEES
jgi:P27 family predicted phage terminase small subunit